MRSIILALTATMMALGATACSRTVTPQATAPPPPTYHGPEFLRGTIGSVTTVRGYEPTLVSGYGLVTQLQHTGSPDVPPELRQWLVNEMTKRGVGTHQFGMPSVSPSEMLASDTTAVVLVEGVIPPGARKGDRFDLLVSALPQTQTTSLEGGVLYTTDLRLGGVQTLSSGMPSMANARGWVFMNPFMPAASRAKDALPANHLLSGHIPGGGMVIEAQPLELVTNQPSYRLTRQIADRINGRYKRINEPDIANPKNDTIVELRLPERMRGKPDLLLELVSHLYLNPTVQFGQDKAQELAELLADPANDKHADQIASAWEGMGPSVLPILRPLYAHDQPVVRLAALSAGARLGDTRAGEPLFEIAMASRGRSSEQATAMLGELLRQRRDNAAARKMLRQLLDADDVRVRIAAYDTLAYAPLPGDNEGGSDPLVQRWQFADKMELAHVEATKPMIYVAREGRPRVIVFNNQLGFRTPVTFSAWDGRFLLRAGGSKGGLVTAAPTPGSNPLAAPGGTPPTAPADGLSVYYKGPNSGPITAQIPATVPYLVGVMAFSPPPRADNASPGLDMSYSQIVQALYQLTQQGHVQAPLVLQPSDLVERIARGRIADAARQRPETAENPGTPGIPPADAVAPRGASVDNAAP